MTKQQHQSSSSPLPATIIATTIAATITTEEE
jgi:hypothetical protein